MMRPRLRAVLAGAVATLVAHSSAWAVSPPSVDVTVPPPSAGSGPSGELMQRSECVTTGLRPGTVPSTASERMLNIPGAWQFSRGEGQTVAVIATGVTPGSRLPDVKSGGDYVGNTDGLTDCDGHGTLIAGIIGGQPGADVFSGVAPAARIVSIRQRSAAYSLREQSDDPARARAALDITTLARAVVRGADSGARVIVIAQGVCLPADSTVDQQSLGAALRYAAVEKDVVVIAPAGDLGSTGLSAGNECRANPLTPSGNPADSRNWGGVVSVAVPAWWQPYVLAVASLGPDGQPSEFTMPGPWVGIAAPGQDIVSLSNAGSSGGLANGVPGQRGQWTSLNGTGYAAAYVAGAAALVRSRFPELTAAEVIQRLQRTAHNGARSPSNLVGSGMVDPVAALTWELPPSAGDRSAAPVRIAAPAVPTPPDHLPRTIAFAGTAVLAVLVASVAFARHRRRDQLQ
ncbi:type VII secretion-associated serine protease mycosin [Mycolicibacterium sp. Y3]